MNQSTAADKLRDYDALRANVRTSLESFNLLVSMLGFESTEHWPLDRRLRFAKEMVQTSKHTGILENTLVT